MCGVFPELVCRRAQSLDDKPTEMGTSPITRVVAATGGMENEKKERQKLNFKVARSVFGCVLGAQS